MTENFSIESVLEVLEGLANTYGVTLASALATLIIGFWVIKLIGKGAERSFQKSKMDIGLQKFLKNIIVTALKILVIVSAITMLGIETTSFVAILGGAGLAVGLALQGSLSNFAGGVLILLFKPFRVGDFIEAQGYSGTVVEIELFNTILHTPDKKRVIIPNAAVSNGAITNFSAEEERRVDFVFGIGYNDDIQKAKELLWDIIKKDERVLEMPESMVVVSELADSSVNITARVWCKSANYWGIYFDTTEAVKLCFDANNISIPYPQQDLHVHMNK